MIYNLVQSDLNRIFNTNNENFGNIKDYIYNKNTRNSIFKLKMKGVEQAYNYLVLLNSELKSLNIVSEQEKKIVRYYDIVDEQFKFYDFYAFNALSNKVYNNYLNIRYLNNNSLYKLIVNVIENVFEKKKVTFLMIQLVYLIS